MERRSSPRRRYQHHERRGDSGQLLCGSAARQPWRLDGSAKARTAGRGSSRVRGQGSSSLAAALDITTAELLMKEGESSFIPIAQRSRRRTGTRTAGRNR